MAGQRQQPPEKKHWMDDLTDTDTTASEQEEPEEVLKGNLRPYGAEREVRCPYYRCLYSNKKDSSHLTNCRRKYQHEMDLKGERMDIAVCRWSTSHHIHVSKFKEHYLKCEFRPDVESSKEETKPQPGPSRRK